MKRATLERIGWVLIWAAFVLLSALAMRLGAIALRCESMSCLYETDEP